MSLKNHCYSQLKQILPQAQPLAVDCLGIPEEQGRQRKTECTVQWQIFSVGISLFFLQRMWFAVLFHYTRTHSTSEAGNIILTFSDAVAILVPCRFKAIQLKTPSWAGMSTGGFSVLARSTICTCPVCVPGNARRELLLFGQRTQRPERQKKKKEKKRTIGSLIGSFL